MASLSSPLLPLPAGQARTGLSGRVVGQLGPGEQFVLWALRQRLADGDTPSPAFLCGFRLAFGLARLEPALAAFECLFDELAAHGRDVGLFPIRSACISTDESTAMALVASAQGGQGPWLAVAAGRLVEAAAAEALGTAALGIAQHLAEAGLALAPLELPSAARSTVH
jgi:hypothetical protein